MKTVLITALGTVTASTVVKELRKTGKYYLIGADINNQKEIATSLDVDEFYKFPYATDEAYLAFVIKFCKDHKIDYYYAVLDEEVVAISKNRDKFERIGTKLCVANYEFVEICHYKDRFSKWIEENSPAIAIRTYSSLEEAKNAVYPLFIKPVKGVASKGCKRIDSFEELCLAVKNENEFVIQEYIEGQNITVDCLRNKNSGQKAQVQRKELLRNANGCGIAVEIFKDEKLEEICDSLIESMDLDGVINIEFFDTDSGYRIIEINPRLSAGAVYSCMAGLNLVLNAMRISDGEACILGALDIGSHYAERYEAYRMD